MNRLATAALLAVGLLLAGCGESVQLPDLFAVRRTGGGAPLTLVVNEGGALRCDGGRTRQLSDKQLVQARGIQEELLEHAPGGLTLAPRPGSVFAYTVRDEKGTVRFSDNSTGQPQALRQLAFFVLEVAQKVCRLPA